MPETRKPRKAAAKDAGGARTSRKKAPKAARRLARPATESLEETTGSIEPVETGTGALTAPAGFEPNRPPSHEEVEIRAYEISQSRRGTGDLALNDWLQAERELRSRGSHLRSR